MRYLAINAVCALCVSAAFALIWFDKPHWGCFIGLAFLIGHTFGKDDDNASGTA